MNDVTQILNAIEAGDPKAASLLFPLIYEELRHLAAAQMAREKPGQTLDATALVHEAFLRLVGSANEQQFENRRHFFAVAAEAMRRILVESARRRAAQKRGGNARRVDLNDLLADGERRDENLLALDEALNDLEVQDCQAAQLVKLRYFSGLTHQQAADSLGITRRQADKIWSVARAWLYQRIQSE